MNIQDALTMHLSLECSTAWFYSHDSMIFIEAERVKLLSWSGISEVQGFKNNQTQHIDSHCLHFLCILLPIMQNLR